MDEFNGRLSDQTYPADWKNPTPAGRYNLVAIGGGTAGIISAMATAELGGRAALIERRHLGGECLNHGCVPSKAVLRAARTAYEASRAAEFGVDDGGRSVDLGRVIQRMRRLQADVSHHNSAWRFTGCGIDVYLGNACFTGPDTVEVDGQPLKFHRAVIAAGSHPQQPQIPGLDEVGYQTSETIFSVTELPRRLLVIGGGPIGCEMAQAFRRFGSDVHLLTNESGLLVKEDRSAAALLQTQFQREGIRLYLGWSVAGVEKTGRAKSVTLVRGDDRRKLFADEILVAIGREPNLAGLNLTAAGVRCSADGVEVDDYLQTSNPAIYAAGDVCSAHRYTHAAEAMARLCVQNALLLGKRRVSQLVMPRCTYTDPEVAQIGLTPQAAAERGVAIDSYRVELSAVDRALLDGEEAGFATIHTRRGTGRVVGATVVASHAGEMIGELSLLMTGKLSLAKLARTIHCYPTQAEVFQRIADSYQSRRTAPRLARWFGRWLAWQRREPRGAKVATSP